MEKPCWVSRLKQAESPRICTESLALIDALGVASHGRENGTSPHAITVQVGDNTWALRGIRDGH